MKCQCLCHTLPNPNCSGWRLVVVGHSLGAAVSSLLTLHLRTRYPGARCWAFSAPFGTMSAPLCQQVRQCAWVKAEGRKAPSHADAGVHTGRDATHALHLQAKAWCTSTVIGKDMIPRLSGHTAQRLLHEMVSAAARCRVSKTRLWIHTLLLRRSYNAQDLFVPEDEVDQVCIKGCVA